MIDFPTVRAQGVTTAAANALERLVRPELDGFWLHVDCDVLDDAVMPAVDYRLPGGLSWNEFETVIRFAAATGRAVGIEVTIFNPTMDTDGSIARTLVTSFGRALTGADE